MIVLLVLSYLLPLALIVHCIRTGRNTLWIWVMIIGGVLGAAAYVLVELLPELLGGRATRRAVRGMRTALDPERTLRRLRDQASVGGGIDAQQRYADALLRQGKADEAAGIYQRIASGLYEHDPNLLLGLARAQFADGRAGDARATLDRLRERNPGFNSAEGHLLYARALEGENNGARALEEFAALARYYPGAEAKLRYAQLLRSSGRSAEARELLAELLDYARIAPRHYRRAQGEWLALAARELAGLK